MLKRSLFFTSAICLSLKNAQIVVSFKATPNVQKSIPIEDVGYVILENQQISATLPLLNALIDNNVAVIICDKNYMPHTQLQPLSANTTQAECYKNQINATEPLKKNLWKQVVEAKIENQSRLLKKLGKDGEMLKPLYNSIKSGDTENKEGFAARLYWPELFPNFVRNPEGEDSINSFLNYGYTILRAAVARSLMGSGLYPAFGIFHRNRYNAFPLADDIMEPYRPFVDEIVYQLVETGADTLNTQVKSELIKIVTQDVVFDSIKRPLDIGLTTTTASLAKCFAGESKKLFYPKLK